MTDREHYALLVDGIFGIGTATFNAADTQSNDVIGALGKPGQFVEFNANFEQRLRRLAASLHADETLRKEILAAINKIVTSEWDGAYAELCALDYFLADVSTGPGNVALDRTVPASQTLASEMGMQNANHDMSFPRLGVSMDTKLLSDKIGGILEGIFKDFRNAKNIEKLTILPSYNGDQDFATYQANRKKLLSELIHGVDVNLRPSAFVSKVISGLSYKFGWDTGVLTAASSYSPLEHAKNHHRLLFGHAKKFSKVEPTVIVFVLFPWTGERVFHFDDSRKPFFKEFGDRFFSDYLSSSDSAKNFNSNIKSAILAGDVTRHLSGILFLEDDSVLAKTPNDLNVKASFLWNPNALHPLAGSLLEARLLARGAFDLQTVSEASATSNH
ncbi:hypothetical protein [Ectopseudomonas oleovorans]|uniref:hypothetical protein n=1 Tax=Ectopseudomonas oleovorans TaxID=301 RepID=UPI001ABEEB6B|nr:hypothetical protein [Pseudomonas indoloxydans]